MSKTSPHLQRLKDEADIESVLSYVGIEGHHRGGDAIFIHCPNPTHSDEHATNCYYKDGWNSVYCAVCGRAFGAIDILMWHGSTFGEAADTLWELEGKPEWYKTSYKKRKEEAPQQFLLTAKEKEILGIKDPGKIRVPTGEIFYEGNKGEAFPYSNNNVFPYEEPLERLSFKSVYVTKNDFLSDEDYAVMAMEKAKEKISFFSDVMAANRGIHHRIPKDHTTSIAIHSSLYAIEVCEGVIRRANAFLSTPLRQKAS